MQSLLEKCVALNVLRVVHLSTYYLQCSYYWPNIYARESDDYEMFCKEFPFPVYCNSKHRAELILKDFSGLIPFFISHNEKAFNLDKHDDLQVLIARCGALYGEGDCSSLICDAICFQERLSAIPLIGDQGGILQVIK